MTDTNSSNHIDPQHTKIVQAILAAPTLYDVLGVSRHDLVGSSNLRKAYLTTSVKVHPDKNPHPQATQAFQRVAEAWGTLSDDTARAEYDAELRRNQSSGGSSGFSQPQQKQQSSKQNNTHYARDFERSHMPSFQEALFMFATATAMFSGSAGAGASSKSASAINAAGDFMETIFWAQQLASNHQQKNEAYAAQKNGDYNHNYQDPNDFSDHHPNNTTDNKSRSSAAASAAETAQDNPLRSGMAIGSGLRALAGAQRAMGMTKGAAATEKAATTVQVAAMGAAAWNAAHDNPAVQRTIERGSATLKNNPHFARGLRASFQMAGTVIAALQEAQQKEAATAQTNNGGTAAAGTARR